MPSGVPAMPRLAANDRPEAQVEGLKRDHVLANEAMDGAGEVGLAVDAGADLVSGLRGKVVARSCFHFLECLIYARARGQREVGGLFQIDGCCGLQGEIEIRLACGVVEVGNDEADGLGHWTVRPAPAEEEAEAEDGQQRRDGEDVPWAGMAKIGEELGDGAAFGVVFLRLFRLLACDARG